MSFRSHAVTISDVVVVILAVAVVVTDHIRFYR